MGEEGFSSDSSLLYHVGVPSAIREARTWELPDQTTKPNEPLLARHLKLHDLFDDGAGNDIVTSRRLGDAKHRLLTCGAGTGIVRRNAPSAASWTTQLPPHIATQNVPSAASVMPSGLPGTPRKSETITGSLKRPLATEYASSVRSSVSTTYSVRPSAASFMPLGTPRPLATRVGSSRTERA